MRFKLRKWRARSSGTSREKPLELGPWRRRLLACCRPVASQQRQEMPNVPGADVCSRYSYSTRQVDIGKIMAPVENYLFLFFGKAATHPG